MMLFFTFYGLILFLVVAFDDLLGESGTSAPEPTKVIEKKNYSFFSLTILINDPSATLFLTDEAIGSLFE